MLLLLLLWGQWPVAGLSSEAWLIWPLSAVPHNSRIGWQRVTNYKRANFQNKKSSRPNCMAWQTSSEALYSLIPTFCLSTSAWSQLRLRKSPQKKTHLLLGISQIAPPPSRILESPAHRLGDFFTLEKVWKSFWPGKKVNWPPATKASSHWRRRAGSSTLMVAQR